MFGCLPKFYHLGILVEGFSPEALLCQKRGELPSMRQELAWLEQRLKPERLQHSLGVAETARRLAGRYGIDENRAYIAGLLHDCARDLSDADLLKKASYSGIVIDAVEWQMPILLHGRVGAWLAQSELEIGPDIESAIAKHVTGAALMSPLDKLIYLADFIEPGRSFPGLAPIRHEAEESLDRATRLAMDHTLRYLIDQRWLIHTATVEARNRLVSDS